MANEFANVNYLEKLKKLTLFDAILFRKAFDLNIPAAETLLRTIMENDKIKVARCKTEYTVTGLASHSVQLDLLATDENGKFFNVEVQTESSVPHPSELATTVVQLIQDTFLKVKIIILYLIPMLYSSLKKMFLEKDFLYTTLSVQLMKLVTPLTMALISSMSTEN